MSAALERRLLALESKASEQMHRFTWMSWQPDCESHEIVSAQTGDDHFQRQQGETVDAFRKRVERTAGQQSGQTLIWCDHGEGQACQH